MNLTEMAALLRADVEGDGEVEITAVARIEQAGKGDLTFLSNPRYNRFVETTGASAVIVARNFDASQFAFRQDPPALVRVDDPYMSFLRVMTKFAPPQDPVPPGIHPTAVVAQTASLGKDVRIGAFTIIGENTVLGNLSAIGNGCVIGEDVSVGERSIIYHNVTIREGCRIGARVILHPGVTIGSDGFGFAPTADGSYEKIPQLGVVVVEDDVEIGANCTVDRATLGETRIKRGAKLDNLIQVAHNVVIGEDTVIAAQSGISGSTKIGRGAMIGGQVGITGHLQIAENTSIGAQSGVHRSIRQPGQAMFGTPALPRGQSFKIHAALLELPELLVSVRRLKSAMERMEDQLARLMKDQAPSQESSS
jgi:UDP-3-O-[3-hydroxymyristoyl] glucosamine N-acyltransferase